MRNYLKNKVKQIKTQFLDSATSLLEKEYVIYGYLLENCTYDTAINVPLSSHTAYSALLTGKAVCDGYSKAAKLLFNECGIDSGIVTSDSMNHSWNYIKMNGYYYFLDVTWDDPVPETYQNRYSYFNRTTDEMKKGKHEWITTDYPAATNTTFSFLRQYDKLTRSNGQLYYYDKSNRKLYRMTLDGKNKTLVINGFDYRSNLELIGYTNNLYYVKSISLNNSIYDTISRYNLVNNKENL